MDSLVERLRQQFPRRETLFYLAVALVASAPAWVVKYPPIQDLPFHLATIRVIHDIHNPAYGFDDIVLTLGRTQYVFYYLVASALSYLVGIVPANVILMSAYLGGTPLALRELLRALGKDPRLSILSVPLLVNVMFMFGLLPFLLGIPLMFWGLATAVRWFEAPTPKGGILLAAIAFALFYSHVFPFGIFGLGFAAMFPWSRPRQWIRAGLPTVPALLALARWTLFTDAGKLTRGALTPGPAEGAAPLNQALPNVFQWLNDVFRDNTDETVLVATFMVAVFIVGLAQGDRDGSTDRSRAYVLLPLACVVLYFTMGEGHDYIWLISQRFPILFLLTAIPLLRMPKGFRGHLATMVLLVLAGASTANTCKHFIRFQLEEVGDIDGALAVMEPKKKVAALIFDKGSNVTNWAPFLHFGSYYQFQKGGIIQFSYAGYAHWPFDYKPGHYPPPGGPARKRWEWTPESVNIRELSPYYDYVLTRGDGFRAPPGTFHLKWRGDKWAVWERD
ncbi:MAG: hypothetical protein U0235_01370 [Polyangiaceae bacterium]